GALPRRRAETRGKPDVRPRLEPRVQPALRVQRVHDLPAAAEAEHPQDEDRGGREVSAAQSGVVFPPRERLTILFAHAAYRLRERFLARDTGIDSFEVRTLDE